MGRKVHPLGFRLGVLKDWRARWFAEGRQYAEQLQEDIAIRDLIHKDMGHAGISTIEIERFPNQVSVTIHTARPGIIIGRKGASVNALRQALQKLTGKEIRIEVQEIEQPESDAYLIAESIAQQLERRISHRRAMKQAATRAMRLGIQGVKIACSGRLGAADMARREWVMEGRVPLQTMRSDIDYAKSEAQVTLGKIGIKVWVYKGEILPKAAEERIKETATVVE